jgi:molybdopterin molybdotransferase
MNKINPSQNKPPVSVDEALAQLMQHLPKADTVEWVACLEAHGRVLAENQIAKRDVPYYDNSAMDGYAIRVQDLDPAEQCWLPVEQQIPAGRTGTELAPGCAARIFTGAPIPPGADAVIKQELCTLRDGEVGIQAEVHRGQNIRLRGEDIGSGETVLEQGIQLRAPQIALAAAIGLAEVPVFRKPRIAVFSTGAEIVEPGGALREGQVFDSNRYALIALVRAIGCNALDCGHLADDLEQTCTGIRAACNVADLVLTSGGVSVGDEDHVCRAIQTEGQLHLWRVAIKPGKPVAFGTLDGTPIFGLPGNPVAAFVTFLVLVRPFLKRMQGHDCPLHPGLPVAAGFSVARAPYRRRYLRVRLVVDKTGTQQLVLHDKQGSAMLTTLSWADGLVEIPEGEIVAEGQLVNFLQFSSLLS